MSKELTKEQLEFLTHASKNHLLNFAEAINPSYDSQWFHEKIADTLEDALQCAIIKKKKRIILSVPPRMGKSQLASIYFPAWALGKYPYLKFIISTYGAELSEKHGKETRDLIDSQAYKMIFPNTTLVQDMKARANWQVGFINDKGVKDIRKGQYYAVGVGGAVTGYGGDCFTGETKILTENGYKRIDTLCKLQDKVLSYNHENNRLEWKNILGFAKRKKSNLLQIKTSNGSIIKCTPDHRIFIKDKGYIRASELEIGDRCISIQRDKKYTDINEMFSLSERVSEAQIRSRKNDKKSYGRCLLFSKLFKTTSCGKEQTEMYNLWKSCCKKDKKILRRQKLQKKLEEISAKGMFILSYIIHAIKLSIKNLFKIMFRKSTLIKNVRNWKFKLQTWNGSRYISERIQKNETEDNQKGQWSMSNLWKYIRSSMSSYRLQSKKQYNGELNNSMQSLSLHTPQEQEDSISSVERLGYKEYVYDIQVEDNHNFFAENTLVHNCIIIDDPHKDRAEAESETMRNAVWDYYRSTLYSRKEGEGVIIVIMQRWREDDLVGRLLEEDEKLREKGEPTEDWEVISLPAIADEDEFYKGELVRKEGESLWKTKFPLSVLESIKIQSGYYWASQYQQNPILAETAEFKKEMFKYYKDEDISFKNLRYYTLVDPAISQKKAADNTVVLTIAKEVGGHNIYRIREDAGKYTPQQTVDLIFMHYLQYHSDIWVETIAYQEALKFMIQEEQRKKQIYFYFNEIKSRSAKETRIRGLLGLYQTGVIWHRAGTDINYELELLSFPKGRRDDRIDCCAFMLQAFDSNPASSSVAKQYRPRWMGYGKKG